MPRKKKTQADSAQETVPQTEALVVAPKEVTVKNADGTTRVALRDDKGHFLPTPKKKPTVPQSEVTRITRSILMSKAPGDSEPRIKKVIKAAFDSAYTCFQNPETAGNGAKVLDSLARWAQIVLPTKTEEQIEAEKHSVGNFKIVINTPVLMHPQPIEEKPEEQLKPSFIDAVVVPDSENE